MSNATRSATNALSLPLIAYRGLWDKFGKPLSDEAVRRSYLRGIPSLIRCGDESSVRKALELARNSTASCRIPSVYLLVNGLSSIVARSPADVSVNVFAIDVDRTDGLVSSIYQWRNDRWTKVGCYIPFVASVRGLTAAALTTDREQMSLVLFESA